MDKDIIVDGIDVSGCDSYTSNYREPMPYGEIKVTEHYCWHINSNCDGKNCDYKEIKRLQAENEELQEKLDNSFKLCSDCSTTHSFNLQVSENKKLKAENERLKEECTLYDCGNKEWAIDYQKLQDEYTELLDRLDDVSYERTEYKQALQEIRDIAEELKSPHCTDCTQVLNKKGKCTGECMYDFSKDILDKINEVIGAEE